MRYLKPDPVPEDLIEKVIHAATRASNPGNSQPWSFIVIRDRGVKTRLAEALREAVSPVIDGMADAETAPVGQRMYAGVKHLLDTFEQIPVHILLGGHAIYPPQSPTKAMVPAALFPAGQNLTLAARALGLGTTLTTFHMSIEPVLRRELALPDDLVLGVMIAMGWPEREFGPVARKPLSEVLHWDRW
jgi:nitroreductase